MTQAERNYTVTEREALGMVYSVRKFRHYLLSNKVVFHVDHQALLYLVSKPQLVGRLARWMLLLQEFNFEIVHTPGRLHAVADFLSRLESGEAAEGISDELPDAPIFHGQVEPSGNWYDQLVAYLLDGALLDQMTADH